MHSELDETTVNMAIPTASPDTEPLASPQRVAAAAVEPESAPAVTADPPFDPAAPPEDPMAQVKLRIDPETVDEDGYVSIWNVAAASMDGKTELARVLASKLLGFLCKQKCDFVFTSSTDAKYLDDWFERDTSLLYDWSPQSEKVDVVAQHAHVPASALLRLLKQKKFNPVTNHNPRRADRVDWFTNQWCIG
jgi:hypothetical protein